jgi:hypothetical protein
VPCLSFLVPLRAKHVLALVKQNTVFPVVMTYGLRSISNSKTQGGKDKKNERHPSFASSSFTTGTRLALNVRSFGRDLSPLPLHSSIYATVYIHIKYCFNISAEVHTSDYE